MMAATLPPLPDYPSPPATSVQRFTADGRPTTAQVNYETSVKTYHMRLRTLLAAMKQYVENQP